MSPRRTTRKLRCPRPSSCSRACTPTSESGEARSECSPPAKNSPRNRKELTREKNRSEIEDPTTSEGEAATLPKIEQCTRHQQECFANDRRPTTSMRRVRYSKYVPDPAGEMSMEDLLSALSDYLLQSGFQNYMFYEMPEGEQNLDALRQAIEQALMDSDLFDEEMRERLQQMQMEGSLEELIEKLIDRMEQEDFISIEDPPDPSQPSSAGGQMGEGRRRNSRSPTKASISWDTRPCATCSDRS